ncbi:hypothetical protein HUJ04_011905 [Dendroctonus ponderosae]|uniref:Nose resistant-to-fluoxetine protein N-terminal domain-containing protein n=1 Tax=Dendroctonus ponderosae TaxID=77166 RepID=A0AAR5P687_DENPD|nr:hypothetical protein HUJ04_011905 [Dendroctonus ponderosae]
MYYFGVVFFLIGLSDCLKLSNYGANSTGMVSAKEFCTIDANRVENASQRNVEELHLLKIWKQFPVDLFWNVSSISSACQRDYQRFWDGAFRNELDSLKLFDASAKPPSGLLSGNINQFGDFEECLQVPRAQYCLALIDLEPLWKKPLHQYKDLIHSHFSITESFDDPSHRVPGFSFVRWGFCIPRSCKVEDLENALEVKIGVRTKVKPGMCQTWGLSPRTWTFGDYLARAYFVSLVIAALIGTALGKKHAIFLQKHAKALQFLKCFDFQENFRQLTERPANRNEYKSVHGVRFFSALALIMAHKTMALLYNPYINKAWMAESQAMRWSVIGRNAIIYTDCFLLVSGLLNAKSLFGELEKSGVIRYKAKLYSRLVRIVPGLLTVILFCTYILPDLGSGPLWPMVVDHHAELCKQYMWRNLLFVHNYFGFERMCLTHTHQVGIDMQLFLVSPVFIYALWRNQRLGLWLIGGLSAISSILRFYYTFSYQLSHVVHFGIPISRMFNTADLSYILPTHRASIYFLGVLLAWLLRRPPKTFSRKKLHLVWGLMYTVGLITWFGPSFMCVKGYQYHSLESALYSTFYPYTWGIAIAWIIYSTECGFGSCFGPLLTWKYFQIFTKISYGVYLIQFPVFFYNVGSTRHAGEFHSHLVFPLQEIVVIVGLSTVLTLLVEMPSQNLHTLAMSRKKLNK